VPHPIGLLVGADVVATLRRFFFAGAIIGAKDEVELLVVKLLQRWRWRRSAAIGGHALDPSKRRQRHNSVVGAPLRRVEPGCVESHQTRVLLCQGEGLQQEEAREALRRAARPRAEEKQPPWPRMPQPEELPRHISSPRTSLVTGLPHHWRKRPDLVAGGG
jgi:hypothetical protein